MKTTRLNLHYFSIVLLFIICMVTSPLFIQAQDSEPDQDTVEVIQDQSSSFNDSVQFDDMEPIFYEAAEDEAEAADEGNMSGITLYVGIAIVLLIALIVLKKVGGKRKTKE